ncbi:hypothetical protein [Vibrio neptunius]|uniref:Uncharacterized protein n=1 Tax=Vibrio neptunius TaxID=170651 RepID=A0ABS3A7Y9_9VIBR|nr:hypothetical protein [Vibrio neptunius]MBN3495717.1 hypothetical protein [Vibrio neptunius]MBN3518191.1 hypothetical protein [Vibrio neptunius]MBN3552491.1 hypothetical protein [Vibrio neptunius]MBN3580601.1 hypothetical protein [Vibrio neptunius]MCH9874267.1 hypothetical protein [Vibrio neptunius]
MWLDTITVRTSKRQVLEEELLSLLESLKNTTDAPKVSIYRKYPPASDLSIHLLWSSRSTEAEKCGIQLASDLTVFGAVDHANWLQLNNPD